MLNKLSMLAREAWLGEHNILIYLENLLEDKVSHVVSETISQLSYSAFRKPCPVPFLKKKTRVNPASSVDCNWTTLLKQINDRGEI